MFLVDSGSTRNFLNDSIAKKIGIVGSGKFRVTVANDDKVPSAVLCKGIQILLQGVPIIVDLFLLPLEGYDVVLGT